MVYHYDKLVQLVYNSMQGSLLYAFDPSTKAFARFEANIIRQANSPAAPTSPLGLPLRRAYGMDSMAIAPSERFKRMAKRSLAPSNEDLRLRLRSVVSRALGNTLYQVCGGSNSLDDCRWETEMKVRSFSKSSAFRY